MRNFVSDDGSLSFTAATALTGGRFYRSGGLVGIIAATVASGAVATLETCGVYEYEKAAEAIVEAVPMTMHVPDVVARRSWTNFWMASGDVLPSAISSHTSRGVLVV